MKNADFLTNLKQKAAEQGVDPMAASYGTATYDLVVSDADTETKAIFISTLSFMIAAVSLLTPEQLDGVLKMADVSRQKVLETLAKEGFLKSDKKEPPTQMELMAEVPE